MSEKLIVRCLCCGELYDIENDCPNIGLVHHSIERAYVVARFLRERGIEQPSRSDISLALVVLSCDGAI